MKALLLVVYICILTNLAQASSSGWEKLIEDLNKQTSWDFEWEVFTEEPRKCQRWFRDDSDYLIGKSSSPDGIKGLVFEYCLNSSDLRKKEDASKTCSLLVDEIMDENPRVLRIFKSEVRCHNCHEFEFYFVFDSCKSELPVLLLNEYWDS